MVNATTKPAARHNSPRGQNNRRKARTIALQVLYEVNSVEHDSDQVLVRQLDDHDASPSTGHFSGVLVRGVLANSEEIDKIITTFAPSWPVSQMAILDRNTI